MNRKKIIGVTVGTPLNPDKYSSGGSGVYVGSGEMPEDCNVQIDPDGEVLDLSNLAVPKLETINTLTTTEDTKVLKIDTDTLGNSFELDEAYAIVEMPSPTIQNIFNFYLTDGTTYYIAASNVKGSVNRFIFEWQREKCGTIEVYKYGAEFHTKKSRLPQEDIIVNQFRIQTWDTEGGIPIGTKITVKGIRK